MENTLENKAKFFAQYWGQPVLMSNNDPKCYVIRVKFEHAEDIDINDYLELKPLSSITDEDLDKTNYGCIEMILEKGYWLDVKNSDLLRSLGYALPWMGLSIEQLQEYGWIKIKSE